MPVHVQVVAYDHLISVASHMTYLLIHLTPIFLP